MADAANLAESDATVAPLADRAELDSAAATIQVLPPAVTSRIAAGEVVERPASVVKELVENALDAGATRIAVDIGGGGLDFIRVSDDGRGMNAADLTLSVLEHATSKIRSAEELPHLTSLGFRGEALPSIASVSRFAITSRPRQSLNAHRLEILGGETVPPGIKAAAGAIGTVVEARDLFYNLPARRKFMKGAAAEAAACTDTLLRLALTEPSAGFSLYQDRREVFSVAPQPTVPGAALSVPAAALSAPGDAAAFMRRARELLGRSNTAGLLELDARGSKREDCCDTPPPLESTATPTQAVLDLPEIPAGYRLYGLISPPAITRANRSAIYLTVNGRPVKDRTLTSALLEAYRHLLPPKRYPLALLVLELPGLDVDANVHPTKTEVRFRIPGLVYALFYYAIRRACGADRPPLTPSTPGSPLTPVRPQPVAHVPLGAPSLDPRQKTFDLWPTVDCGSENGDCGLRIADCGLDGSTPVAPGAPTTPGDFGLRVADCGLDGSTPAPQQSVAPHSHFNAAAIQADSPPFIPQSEIRNPQSPQSPQSSATEIHEAPAAYARPAPTPSNPQSAIRNPQSPHSPHSPFRVLGQAGGSYIVLEDDTGVKLIDQHALHERVLFEDFLEKAHRRARGESQGLLTPQIFDLTPVQCAVFTQDDSARELLQHLGFTVELFGDRAIAVRALPAILKSADKAALVLEVLDALSETSDADPSATRSKHRYSLREKAAYMLACKGALKAGERLTIEQMTALVEDYRRKAGPNSFTCPHGRPVALELGWDELEKAVGR